MFDPYLVYIQIILSRIKLFKFKPNVTDVYKYKKSNDEICFYLLNQMLSNAFSSETYEIITRVVC